MFALWQNAKLWDMLRMWIALSQAVLFGRKRWFVEGVSKLIQVSIYAKLCDGVCGFVLQNVWGIRKRKSTNTFANHRKTYTVTGI